MFSPRWQKVFRDLGSNKTRTVLVVLAIAVGIFTFGSVFHHSGSPGSGYEYPVSRRQSFDYHHEYPVL